MHPSIPIVADQRAPCPVGLDCEQGRCIGRMTCFEASCLYDNKQALAKIHETLAEWQATEPSTLD